MGKSKKIVCMLLCLVFCISTLNALASQNYEFDVIYYVAEGEQTSCLSINFVVINNTNENKNFNFVAVMFDSDGWMKDVTMQNIESEANSQDTIYLSMTVEGQFKDEYVKCFVVEDFLSMRLLGEIELIQNLNPNITEHYTYFSCQQNDSVNVFLKTYNTSEKQTYTLCYNPEHIEIVDLCSFTYEKETSTGEIEGTGITIEKVDEESGRITFSVSWGCGWSGYNIIKFDAKKELSSEKIMVFSEVDNED